MSSKKSTENLKNGEEPSSLLLALLSTQVTELVRRKEALLLKANTDRGTPVVYIVLPHTTYDHETDTIVQVKDKLNGNRQKDK